MWGGGVVVTGLGGDDGDVDGDGDNVIVKTGGVGCVGSNGVGGCGVGGCGDGGGGDGGVGGCDDDGDVVELSVNILR